MCAGRGTGGEVGRLLLRGPVATGILDPYAPAVLPFRPTYKPSPRKIPSSENLRANAEWRSKGDVAAYTHFVVLSRHVNQKTRLAKEIIVCILSPLVVFHERILADLPRIRATDYAALITRASKEWKGISCRYEGF